MMSYQEKRTIVTMAMTVLILVVYGIYSFNQYQAGVLSLDDLRPWAVTILVFIGISIVVMIAIQIIFHILLSISIAVSKKVQDMDCDDHEIEKSINAEMVEDEMDKVIGLKSSRVGFICAGVGFIAGLISLLLNYPPVIMLNIMFLCMWSSSLFSGITQLVYYRRGV